MKATQTMDPKFLGHNCLAVGIGSHLRGPHGMKNCCRDITGGPDEVAVSLLCPSGLMFGW